MPTERVQRQIDSMLDEVEAAVRAADWDLVTHLVGAVLALDPENADARAYGDAAHRAGAAFETTPAAQATAPAASAPQPSSFANGRYTVTRFLGEGGKKKVYLARDSLLDRDVALALIKTEGLDEAARQRVSREAQAMGRLGAHPNIVTVFDIGEENSQPFLILPVMNGGDVEGVIEDAPDHRLPLERAIEIAVDTCKGLEFSHSKGIVHRDLKPGNVWLTEDGRAMIGDFGLAVAVDKSRLTQAGMMVGTVNYMPPEQAMGGEVGPRSDLYSLGAMLYEMVCGRPPFVGDESVAIIGQHLNTPPVAPSWHRPDCPPALEALILRLLEKDPNKRPGSAIEVREALESVGRTRSEALVGRGAESSTSSESATMPADNPLYRRTFVGRENEVRQLQQAFDAALSGQGGLVMVVGEPGIGKTALCEQLATYVALRGGKALVGHCYEEGSLSLPYLAFVEAMRSYVLAREPDGLRTDLGTGAADVARIVSEVQDRVQGVELRPAGDPEDDRWRLLQAVTSFLRNASTVQPLCIVLEDLHWADRGTLDLLLHASRNLLGARLLIVGTYRDVEVDRSHPLSNALADLRRASNFTRVPLRGLTVDEVHRMYEVVRGGEVSWAQAEAVFRQTEGNPLFVQEMLRYLVEEGFVVREDGRWVATQGVGAGIPEGLRDVIGKRLSRLSADCNRVLGVAAVIGRDFDLATLRAIAALTEDDLLSSIEEAVHVGVLDERSLPGAVRYRFAHAFFRTSLYEEMIAPRRLRLHQEVARALEAQYASRREEHAAELAEHYGQSTDRADLAKAVEYSEMAAKRAMGVFAYAEAEGHLRRCLEVQEVLDPDDTSRRCDLLISLSEAILPQPDPIRVAHDISPEAYALASKLGDRSGKVRISLQACESITRTSRARASFSLGEWPSRADESADDGTFERVYADLYVGRLAMGERGPVAGHAHLRQAVRRALDLGDDAALFAAASIALGSLRALRDGDLRLSLANEVISRPHAAARSVDLIPCLAFAARTILELGDRDQAEALWSQLIEVINRSHDATLSVWALQPPVFQAFLDGSLEEADRRHEEAMSRTPVGVSVLQTFNAPLIRVRTLAYLGRLDDSLMPDFGDPEAARRRGGSPAGAIAFKSLYLAYLNRTDDALALFSELDRDISSEDDETATAFLVALLEMSVICHLEPTAAALLPRLSVLSERLAEVTLGTGVEVSLGRLLGEAAILLGKTADARQFFDSGLAVSQRARFRPEIALIRLDLAELLLEHYPDEHDAAIRHLDFAIAELRDMKMQPALERALRHRGLLKA